MIDKEMLDAMRSVMREELEPINKRLDGIGTRLGAVDTRLDAIQEDIEILKEDGAITREAVNTLLEWADVMDATTLRQVIERRASNGE